MKKKELSLLIMMLACMLICGCSNERQKEAQAKVNVKMGIESMQKELPIQSGSWITITDASYEDDVVEITYTINDQLMNCFQKIKDDKTVTKRIWSTNLAALPEESMKIFRLMVDAKANLKAILIGENSREKVLVQFSTDELSRIVNQDGDPKELAREYMEAQADFLKLQTPQAVDEATTLIDVELTDTEFRYIYELDEDAVDWDILISNLDNIKTNIKMSTLSSPETSILVNNARKAGVDLMYVYQYGKTGKSVEINATKD